VRGLLEWGNQKLGMLPYRPSPTANHERDFVGGSPAPFAAVDLTVLTAENGVIHLDAAQDLRDLPQISGHYVEKVG